MVELENERYLSDLHKIKYFVMPLTELGDEEEDQVEEGQQGS